MPCYKPMIAWRLKFGGKSKIFWHFVPGTEEIKLPCGRCVGCRLERARQWAVRCVYEAQQHKDNCFVTLTYSDENIPFGSSLYPRHLELFWKRLRKEFPGKKIKYFAAGEYGERTQRPHYHAIIFGLKFEDLKLETIQTDNGLKQIRKSATLERIWGLGHCALGEVSFESASYVARYCMKKILGNPELARKTYGIRLPEFSRMSKGIAESWFEKFKDSVYPNDRVISRGRPARPPRYFDRKLEQIDPGLLEEIKLARSNRIREEDTMSRLNDRMELTEYKLKKRLRDF